VVFGAAILCQAVRRVRLRAVFKQKSHESSLGSGKPELLKGRGKGSGRSNSDAEQRFRAKAHFSAGQVKLVAR